MSKPWEDDNCEALVAYYSYYSVPMAAALWCRVPPDQVDEILKEAKPAGETSVFRGVLKHPLVPCLEPRTRAINEAIDAGQLKCGRENGKVVQDRVAYERRRVTRPNLKAWIAREFPSDKPAFLFDEIERGTHTAITADAYRTLQADRDALKARIEKATTEYKKLKAKQAELAAELARCRKILGETDPPGERAETTFLNIIGALVELMLGASPAGKRYSAFDNQSAIISTLLAHHVGKAGISKRTLEDKFAAAKRSLGAS